MPKVRSLSPRAWLNRCASAYPESAAQVLEGLTSDDGAPLLRELKQRFEAFDSFIGTCPVRLSSAFVSEARTLLGSLKKFRDPYGDPTLLETEAIDRFCVNNAAAGGSEIPRRFEPGMREFLTRVLDGYERSSAKPTFSGGAVFEHISPIERWEYVEDLSYGLNLYSYRDPGDMFWWGRGPSQGFASRLCAVPKDWDKKRLITVEPFLLSYLQHWTRRRLWRTLALHGTADLKALVQPKRLRPQERHQLLAQRGSMDGTLATLDMSDASDLVSLDQVLRVFPAAVATDLIRARSEQYIGKAHSRNRTLMFGGMGNGTTFTVETLMFHAACYAVARYHCLGFNDSFISCYGDDMIVSTRLAEILLENDIFAEFGWKVNANKSYWRSTSRFRESCGRQFYAGDDVTLIRYQGGYGDGVNGLQAYCDLIRRAVENPRWRPLTWELWEEQNMPNSHSYYVPGALITAVPWWPETIGAPVRRNCDLQEREAYVPMPRIPCRVHPVSGLGPVYGALAGQLTGTTGSRRFHGRRVHGVLVPDPRRATVANRWATVGAISPLYPFDGSELKAPGITSEVDAEHLYAWYKRHNPCMVSWSGGSEAIASRMPASSRGGTCTSG